MVVKKLSLSLLALVAISSVAQAKYVGPLTPDAKVGNVTLAVGQATFENESETLYNLSFGGNYYYDNGIMSGAGFGIGYTTNPDDSVDTSAIGEIEGQFRLGYSFGKLAYGFGVYGIVEFSYLMYNSSNINPIIWQREDTNNYASGIGYGGGLEYRFENGILLNATYTTASMTPDQGVDFDYDKALFGVGYSW